MDGHTTPDWQKASTSETKGPESPQGIPGEPGRSAEPRPRRLSGLGHVRIAVVLVGVDPSLEDAIASRIGTRWDPAEVVVVRRVPPEGGFDGLLIIGDAQKTTPSRVPVMETMDTTTSGLQSESFADLLLRIDTKLGRLTNSRLLLHNAKSYLAKGAKFSRRDLLLGVSNGFREHSSFPFVFEDRCEARYGCSRCIKACPTAALTEAGGTVKVSEEACIKCGLCAASCFVGAVQLPEFSDEALAGLLDKIDESPIEEKTLVLTCDSKAISLRPGMVVEEVPSVGVVGKRQVVAAAATSVRRVGVICPDGKCVGKESAKAAVDAVRASVADQPSFSSLFFAEGPEYSESLAGFHESSRTRRPRVLRSGDAWRDYISDLTTLLPPDSRVAGLGLSKPSIADSCTLCGACVRTCPHDAIRHDEAHLRFTPSMCTGCGACVDVCPEQAIVFDDVDGTISDVARERELYEDDLVNCVGCGEPIGSVRMVKKVSSLLGPGGGFVRYCPSCKRRLAVGAILGGSKIGR